MKIDYNQLIKDFVVGDRRLGEMPCFPGYDGVLATGLKASPTPPTISNSPAPPACSKKYNPRWCESGGRVSLPTCEPMPLAVLREAFDHPDWLFEVKYDGFRALAYLESASVRLVSRKGNVYKSFPGLCTAIAATITRRDALVDGEIAHLDSAGKPQFLPLLHRRPPLSFVAFDLLWLDGKDLRALPLIERKGILRKLVPAGSLIFYTGDGGNGRVV